MREGGSLPSRHRGNNAPDTVSPGRGFFCRARRVVAVAADPVTKVLMGPRAYPDGTADETLYPRAWFMNDRRYPVVLRASG